MDAEARFVLALARHANELLHATGAIYMRRNDIEAIAKRTGIDEPPRRHVLSRLDDESLLTTDNGHTYKGAVAFALDYEKQGDRPTFWARNGLRREVLSSAASAFDRQERRLRYDEQAERFIDAPYAEAVAAARVLDSLGLIRLQLYAGHSFAIRIEPAGYDLARSEDALKRELPLSATEDEDAHATIARDALDELISELDQLLASRGWEGARRELARGDTQYEDRHWVDAVSEYYSAIESGLKHRFDELGIHYGASASLRDLAREAAKADLIPRNYQDLFTFADSIRSPRRHGAGSSPQEVPVGPAEALLIANVARALLLYLGHRPK
jgi:hypothetical protein